MMYAELYRYFILHKRLSMPGIGTFLLERKPAESDFLNRQIKAPVHSIAFANSFDTASKKFFTWLGNALNISDRDAVIRFNDFAFDMKKQIGEGATINWNGVGSLSKGLAGEIKFTANKTMPDEKPVTAEKIIREKAEHMVRVGKDQKTSAEMTEILNKPAVARSLWWVYALAVGILAMMFIGWYLSEHGVDVSATANTTKLVPMETAP
jgi:hypothetical protein